jgi:cobalt-zinc-cadmium efflux system protein
MEHSHDHDHRGHSHSHVAVIDNINTSFWVGIGLNFLFVVIEVVIGLLIHSLSLLSDAGHNLADVGALALSLLAYKLLKVKPNDRYTYGYSKTSILVALFNAMVLMVSIGAIIYEAMHRFLHPEPLPGFTIAIVAVIGIVINAVTALMFLHDKDKDLNIKSAYLHLMGDAVVSLALAVGGVMMYYTHWYWLDPMLSVVVAVVILANTWSLLKDSLRLSLDGVPANVNIDEIRRLAINVEGVLNLHHIHVWAMSTTKNAMTGHIVVPNGTSQEQEHKIKSELKHILAHQHIQHVTLETEWEDEECGGEEC